MMDSWDYEYKTMDVIDTPLAGPVGFPLAAKQETDMAGTMSNHATKRVYIAGPMRGMKDFNFPAFFEAESYLTALGYEPFNPARADNEKYGVDVSKGSGEEETAAAQFGFSLREALGRDLAWIAANADAIYMLRGWENSTGAQAEWALARALKLQIMYQEAF